MSTGSTPQKKSTRLEVASDELIKIQSEIRLEKLLKNPPKITRISPTDPTIMDLKNKADEFMEKIKEENKKPEAPSCDPEFVLNDEDIESLDLGQVGSTGGQ